MIQLITSRLFLREFRESDYAEFRAWDSDPEIQRYELGHPSSEVESRFFFDQILRTNQENPRQHWRFAITRREGDADAGRAIGRISLTVASNAIREYEMGWTVNREQWGSGIATEAAHAVMGMAFSQFNAHRIIAFCHIDNIASQRVMQKLGMSPEAHYREALWIDNRWQDELSYAILDREFSG